MNCGDWRQALAATGIVSDRQLQTHWNTRIAELDGLSGYVLFHQAVWDPARFQRGAREQHRLLVTETYIRLCPVLDEWSRPANLPWVVPDAWVRLAGVALPLAVEADTGKETEKQWREKLDGYRRAAGSALFGLLIVARGGPIRHGRLAAWVADAQLPLPTAVTLPEQLPADALALASRPTSPPRPDTPAPRRQSRTVYRLVGNPRTLSPHEAEALLKNGGFGEQAREIVAGHTIIYLAPRVRP